MKNNIKATLSLLLLGGLFTTDVFALDPKDMSAYQVAIGFATMEGAGLKDKLFVLELGMSQALSAEDVTVSDVSGQFTQVMKDAGLNDLAAYLDDDQSLEALQNNKRSVASAQQILVDEFEKRLSRADTSSPGYKVYSKGVKGLSGMLSQISSSLDQNIEKIQAAESKPWYNFWS